MGDQDGRRISADREKIVGRKITPARERHGERERGREGASIVKDRVKIRFLGLSEYVCGSDGTRNTSVFVV